MGCNTGSLIRSQRGWDMAMALYAGSREGRDGYTGRGVFLHHLADESCQYMQTCGQESDSLSEKSFINFRLLQLFRNDGQRLIVQQDCNGMLEIQKQISSLLVIPLVQNVLRLTYRRNHMGEDNSDVYAESSAYATALLPLIYMCDESDASKLHALLEDQKPSFGKVKQLLQKHYSCLAISCHHVGGYYNPVLNDYYTGAEPCKDQDLTATATPTSSPPLDKNVSTFPPPTFPPSAPSSSSERGIVIGSILVGLLFFAILLVVILQAVRKNQIDTDAIRNGNAPEFRSGDEIVDFT